MPIKPLSFKGDKKSSSKKRKHRTDDPTSTSHSNDAISSTDPQEDDSWTTPDAPSDLTGPTIIILPTIPPTCLAADANGNVFASQLENIVESHAETAEPHDVRQVWIANQIPGTGSVSFKGSHGGYLSCDAMGVLGARREARGVEEGFRVEMVEGMERRERWAVRTAARGKEGEEGGKGERFLSARVLGGDGEGDGEEEGERKKVSVELRGDAEVGEKSAEMVIKMQARFKPRVQQDKEEKAKEKVSRKELEHAVGRRLDDDEVKRLKRARKNGTYHEEILDVRVKGKHDKFA